jgi:hypothetical protein
MKKKLTKKEVSAAMAAVGRLGGEARAKKLSPERRREIAKSGALARSLARATKLGDRRD